MCLVLGLSPSVLAAGHPFTDVPDGAWYSGAVEYVYERGMMGGSGSETTFMPDSPMSRGMLAAILHRMEGLPAAGKAMYFADVPAGEWYTDAVAWAGANGIVSGDGDNFMPNDPLTREQMASILYRYAGYKGYDTAIFGHAAAFPDGDTVSSYVVDAVNWAVGYGLLQGIDGALFPASDAARAQAASILVRLCEDVAHSHALTLVSAINVMCEPSGILFLGDGSFLVTDTYNKVIWRVADGASAVYAGGDTVADPYGRPIGGYNDAALEDSYFKRPWAIAPFLDGCAVSDADNDVVRLIRDKTTETVNGSTKENLTVSDLGVAFHHPTGLASDEAGNLYVSDTYEGAVRQIRNGVVSTLARRDVNDLTTFIPNSPVGLAVRGDRLYVCDSFARKIFVISLAQ